MALPLDPATPPMEARPVPALPSGARWRYEPKWDGFRCFAFRDHAQVELRSKSGQSLGRYFPDVAAALAALKAGAFVLDGEIVIPIERRLSFEALQLRLHPAESRVRKLHRAGAGRPEPLEHRTCGRMAAIAADTDRRGALRPGDRPPLPPRHDDSALAARQGAAAMHLRPAPRRRRRRDGLA